VFSLHPGASRKQIDRRGIGERWQIAKEWELKETAAHKTALLKEWDVAAKFQSGGGLALALGHHCPLGGSAKLAPDYVCPPQIRTRRHIFGRRRFHSGRLIEVWIVMNAILILLAVSAILGLVLGFYFSWKAIAVSALVLAFLSAAVLQNEGFGFLVGIGIIVICLTVNQMAYLIGITLVARDPQDE
jgi:hypothetical protein